MENLPTPLSRVELYLAKACGMDVTVPEQPLSRLEQFLAILAGDTSITMPTPMSLTEQWLAYVLGVTPDPLLAVEGACLIGAQKVDVRYFAVAASMPGATLPEAPQNRAEMYWAHIAGNPPTPGILKYITGKYFYLTDVVSGIDELQYVKGDTYQQTYSGKNLFNTPASAGQTYRASDSQVDANSFGITSTGTTSGTAYIRIDKTLQASQTYTLTWKSETTSGNPTSVAGKLAVQIGTSGAIPTPTESPVTVTTDSSGLLRLYFYLGYAGSGTTTLGDAIKVYEVQIEQGSTPTAYEPYTNGPAPNPDYPQPIQVVTGEQTVTISDGVSSHDYSISLIGKNILNTSIVIGGWSATGTYIGNTARFNSLDKISVFANTTYTFSGIPKDATKTLQVTIQTYDSEKNIIAQLPSSNNWASVPYTFTTPNNCAYITFSGRYTDDTKFGSLGQVTDAIQNVQIELGYNATPYAPYYNYELCKIGDYQDYIYKSGDDWYVHKETWVNIADGNTVWTKSQYGTNNYSFVANPAVANGTSYITKIFVASDCFTGVSFNDRASTTSNISYTAYLAPNTVIFIRNNKFNTVEELTTFCASNPITFRYVLATPTDTKITDATLIGQLNALNSATLPKPIANITVSATGTNLTPYLTIAYYGSDEE